MSSAERLLSEILALPIPERANLVHRVLESLESVPDDNLDEAWLAELEKRAHDVKSGAVTAIPWESARETVITELQKRRAARLTP